MLISHAFIALGLQQFGDVNHGGVSQLFSVLIFIGKETHQLHPPRGTVREASRKVWPRS